MIKIIMDTLEKVKRTQKEYGGLKERASMLSEVGVQYPESIYISKENSFSQSEANHK